MSVLGAQERIIVQDLNGSHPLGLIVPRDLLEAALHLPMLQQRYRSHQITDQNEIALRLHVQRDNVVEVTALQPQILVARPLKQSNRAVNAGQHFAIEFDQRIAGALDFFLGHLAKLSIGVLVDDDAATLNTIRNNKAWD